MAEFGLNPMSLIPYKQSLMAHHHTQIIVGPSHSSLESPNNKAIFH